MGVSRIAEMMYLRGWHRHVVSWIDSDGLRQAASELWNQTLIDTLQRVEEKLSGYLSVEVDYGEVQYHGAYATSCQLLS